MTTEVRVPQLPESVADATLVAWHKKAGDSVARDENLADLETDKVVLEVPAPAAGIVKSIAKDSGATVTSGELLAVIEEQAGASAPAPAAPKAEAKKPAESRKSAAASAPPAPPPAASRSEEAPAKLSPAARRLVEENKLAAGDIAGSGRDGRISKSDVAQHLEGATQARSPSAMAGREDRRVPMSRLRARIAERLVEAQSTAALLTTFNEIDLQALMALRARYKDAFEKRHGVRLGFTSFFTKACIEALRRFPVVNASVEGADIVYHDYYDVGVAVSTDRGLVVPVLRDADRMDFAAIEKAVTGFAERARTGSITLEELTGGTFSITNGGVFGSLMSTPIVNAPQSAILGMHKIQERPVAMDGQVAVRPMMYVALTYDHRIIDGREAVQFLVAVKEALEDPARLLLQV
ncbi:MAG TPA: 2-oxoglutarate dehydrogenase complex dihydrolipoyllysine-residue succinyltransferase [Steroidobacteraceae bacterium]|nr:2-oxoglutarate dehydrogenase complex dihydrolipoyllysine-residue succinyltransferase [Steroidobacteraceae bacterium]